MTALEKLLTLSREREAKATKGPWSMYEDNYATQVLENEHRRLICDWLKRPDAQFIAAARTEVRALRSMLERAVARLNDLGTHGARQKAVADLAIEEITRLAEEALKAMGEG